MRLRAFFFFLIIAAAIAGFGFLVASDWKTPGPLAQSKTIVLPRGSGTLEIAQRLGDEGVVAHPWLFLAGAAGTGTVLSFKAGEYEIPAGSTPEAVAALLASGRVVQHHLTIPEGLTSAEIVAVLDATPGLEGAIAHPPAEGALLPETYFYALGDTRQSLLERMRTAQAKLVDELWASRAKDLPFRDPEEALTLASIVEKETGRDDERAHVAGVFLNRLRLGMPLQADPTVIYAITKGERALERPLDHDDLGVESPYNTYLVKGLPPTPIANPGLAAIKATLHPMKTDDIYFVADGTGRHVFARTLAEHNQHVTELRRLQSQGTKPAPPPR
jgi:peptidoglycan lytic transglycosylase G